MKRSVIAGAALLAGIAVAASAQERRNEFRGRVDAGPLPWCMSITGYDISSAKPQPAPGACIQGSGRVAKDTVSVCMVGTILEEVRWRPWQGCR